MRANDEIRERQEGKQSAGIFISKQTLDTILRQKTRHVADMIALLNFYHYTALWQKTNQPQATVSYVMKGLHWPPDRVRAARSLLSKLKLIEDIRTVDSQTGKVTGWYIRLSYFHPIKNHPTDFPQGGFYHSVENPTTNALRSVSINALRSVKEPPNPPRGGGFRLRRFRNGEKPPRLASMRNNQLESLRSKIIAERNSGKLSPAEKDATREQLLDIKRILKTRGIEYAASL